MAERVSEKCIIRETSKTLSTLRALGHVSTCFAILNLKFEILSLDLNSVIILKLQTVQFTTTCSRVIENQQTGQHGL